MEINNLAINILYCMCNPLNGQLKEGTINRRAVFEEFSDIPEGSVISAIDSMAKDGLIAIDQSCSRISITEMGINRLQSSIACRIYQFDRCQCGSSIGRQKPG